MPSALSRDDRRAFFLFASLRAVVLLILVFAFLGYVGITWRWPLAGDSQVLHYVTFLMHHGFAPYRDIGDMNMPGAYLCEKWALAVFGHSDFGWRLYDYTLAVVLGGGMVWISRRYDWLAGITAAAVFTLTHGADGPMDAGQRDQVIAVLLVLACAFLFESVRKRRWWWMLPFGFAAAFASAVKPTFLPFAPALFLCAAIQLNRERIKWKAYLGAAVLGCLAAFLIAFGFLLRYHAMGSFFSLFTQTLPHYTTLEPLSWPQMFARNLTLSLYALTALGLLAACLLHKTNWNWEMAALLVAAAFGELSYLVQKKGFPQHRYTLIAFLLLWAVIQLWTALTRAGTPRLIASVGLFAICFYIVPVDLYRTHSYPQHDDFTTFLESDLSRLGPARLQKNVQCFDIIDGCLTALFHLGIVQSTGATGDLLFFQPRPAPQVTKAREIYARLIEAKPPDVYVISNFDFGQPSRDFNKLLTWPAFNVDLNANYLLAKQREFGSSPTSNPGTNPDIQGYRIYIRKSSPLAGINLP